MLHILIHKYYNAFVLLQLAVLTVERIRHSNDLILEAKRNDGLSSLVVLSAAVPRYAPGL